MLENIIKSFRRTVAVAGLSLGLQGCGGVPTGTTCIDNDNDGFYATENCGTEFDCNDDNYLINPNALELCDGVDNNCREGIDEDFNVGEACYKGVGECQRKGTYSCEENKFGTICNAVPSNPMEEICDGKDNNCNYIVDDGVLSTFYQDSDGDSFGNSIESVYACDVPQGYVTNADDCNDNNPEQWQGLLGYIDADGDEYTEGGLREVCSGDTLPTGYSMDTLGEDCDDANISVWQEIIAYVDSDDDGFGYGNIVPLCIGDSLPANYALNDLDCDDNNFAINPFAYELCDYLDNNCNDLVDEGVKTTFYFDADGDGRGNANNVTQDCQLPIGYVTNSNDCNDADASAWQEVVAHLDNDGDGFGNENMAALCLGTSLPAGYSLNGVDCNDGDANIHPLVQEICDYIDNNCNGLVDEGVTSIFHQDIDGDGFGNPYVITEACTEPQELWVADYSDCDDSNININPLAPEGCDGLDNNCNDYIDDNLILPSRECTLGVGECEKSGLEYKICEGTNGWSAEYYGCDAIPDEPGEEICDCADHNCDGAIDCGDLEGKIVFTMHVDTFGNPSDSTGNYEIYAMDADGCNLTNLTNYPTANEVEPVWSPDDTKVAFVSGRDGNSEIYIMNADGSEQINVTNNPASDLHPEWSPDGNKIAFCSSRDTLNYKIYLMDVDGSNPTSVPNTSNYGCYSPFSWSPNGSKITLTGSGGTHIQIYTINIDGSNKTLLTDTLAHNLGPVWSPDGTKIAFQSQRDGREIYVMNADGSYQTNLTNGSESIGPAWSPDGSKVAFNHYGDFIYIMDSDGSNLRKSIKTYYTNEHERTIDWSF